PSSPPRYPTRRSPDLTRPHDETSRQRSTGRQHTVTEPNEEPREGPSYNGHNAPASENRAAIDRCRQQPTHLGRQRDNRTNTQGRSEEHTSELQSRFDL